MDKKPELLEAIKKMEESGCQPDIGVSSTRICHRGDFCGQQYTINNLLNHNLLL